jgi:hypothetical protein
MNSLEAFENSWGLSAENPHRITDKTEMNSFFYNQLDLTDNSSIYEIQEKFQCYINKLLEIYNDLKKTHEMTNFETIVRINRILEIVYYAKSFCVSSSRISDLMDLNNDYRDNCDANLFRFATIDDAKNNAYQNFLLFLLDSFYESNYARYNNDIYQMKFTEDMMPTYSWIRIDSIQNVIYSLIRKETNYNQFLNATTNMNAVKQAAEFLTNCQDSQFRELKKDRRIFAFKNGLYFAKEDRFLSYKEKIPANTVAAKYFDIDFQDLDCPSDQIPTPYFDSIFQHQKIDDDVLRWIYVFTGRLIYEIDEMDGWQVIFFVQGQAGTGKSTYVMNVCKQLYDEEDVGVMSNNIQTKFGLSDLVDKLLYVAPEIKRDFSIEQGEFQSIVSGDKVTINIKCKSSRFENWKIPGIMAGNESPDFVDNSGSIQRRMASVKFNYKVQEGDLMLGKKLQTEMGNILRKCNRYYLEYAEKYGRKNVWTVLPEYFANTRAEIARSTNALIHYLSSGKVSFGEDKYIPEKVFIQLFNQHCMDNNYKKCRFNQDFYTGPFSQFNITVENGEKRKYFGKNVQGPFFVGVDIVEDDEPLLDDEDSNL